MAESNSGDATTLQLAGWNQQCSEEHLAEIADSITDWRAVSPYLGLSDADESAILGSSPHSVAAQKIAMLRKWKHKRGTKATYKRLCRIFGKCGLRDLREKVTELLLESSSSSDGEGKEQIILCKYNGRAHRGVEGSTKQQVR